MPEAQADSFVRFVSSVEGRIVGRWDAPGSSFGARLATRAEREEGAEPFTWDTECVVPLTAAFCAKYDRELRNAMRGGDLLERTREDWQAWLKLEEEREVERVKRVEAAAAEAAKPATEPTAEAPVVPAPGNTTPPPEAESTKPEGRKKK